MKSRILFLILSMTLLWSCTQPEDKFLIGISQCSQDEWRNKQNEEMLRQAAVERNMELEIRSLFLRFCPDCAARFRGLRMNKDLVEQFRETIKNLTEEEIMSQSPVVVKFGDMEISFTQTHIAEIREVFRELDKPE